MSNTSEAGAAMVVDEEMWNTASVRETTTVVSPEDGGQEEAEVMAAMIMTKRAI